MDNELVAKYIGLCSDLSSRPEDFTKSNTKKHNKAATELLLLATEISQNSVVAEDIFGALINDENINVRVSAATNCLKFGFHLKEAENVLEAATKDDNKILSFGAEMSLKVWRGEVPGKTL